MLIYLILINAAAFICMLVDKQKAKKRLWRIPESTLLLLAAIGGSLGTYAGMQLCRHKTLKLRFSIGVPVMLAVHIMMLIFCFELFL